MAIFISFLSNNWQDKNYRFQRDSSSDRQSRRRARWPLDHHNNFYYFYVCVIKWTWKETTRSSMTTTLAVVQWTVAAGSVARGQWFESRQFYAVDCIEKSKIKRPQIGVDHFKTRTLSVSLWPVFILYPVLGKIMQSKGTCIFTVIFFPGLFLNFDIVKSVNRTPRPVWRNG